MEDNEDEPEDVRKATPVAGEIKSGAKDEVAGNPKATSKKKGSNKPSRCDKNQKKSSLVKSEADCCRSRITKPTKNSKTMSVLVYSPSCTLPRLEIIPRHCLSKQEYIDVLAAPSRKCPPSCLGKTVMRKVRSISARTNELAQPARRLIVGTLQERGETLPPEMINNLVKSIEGSACMTPEQAEQYFRDKERGKDEKGVKNTKRKCKGKSKSHNCPSQLDKEAVMCQYLMAERFVKSILRWKCPIPVEEFQDIASVILRRLSFVLEYTPTDGLGDLKSQQMRFLADIIACWISGVLFEVAEEHRKELDEEKLDYDGDEEEEDEEVDEENEETEELMNHLGENDEEEDDDEPKDVEKEKPKTPDDVKAPEKPIVIKPEPLDYDDKKSKELADREKKLQEAEERTKLEEERRRNEAEEAEKAWLEAEERRKQEMEEEEENARAKAKLAEEVRKKRQAEEEAEENRRKKEAEERRRREEEEAAVAAADQRRKKKQAEEEEEEENRRKKEEDERKRKEKEEDERNRKEKEEDERKRKEKEEDERNRKEKEEDERNRKDKEEDERKRKDKEEDERKRNEKEDEDEERRIKEEEDKKKKEIEDEEKRKKEAEMKKKKEEEVNLMSIGPNKAIDGIGDGELFKTDLPFVTFGKILDTVYSIVEDEPEGDETDIIHNRIQGAIYEKFARLIELENPKELTENLKDVIDVLSGKAATWVKRLLKDSEVKFMSTHPPEVESKEIRDWGKWIYQVTDRAGDWAEWIHRVVNESEKKSTGPSVNRGDWQNWTSDTETNALLWRRYYLETVHQAHHNKMMVTDRPVVKTGEKGIHSIAEEEINDTDLTG